MYELKIGDNVRLKLSGSPQMVVNKIDNEVAECIYMRNGCMELVFLHKNTLILTKNKD